MALPEILTILVSFVTSVISIANITHLMLNLMRKAKSSQPQKKPTMLNIKITDDSGKVIEAKSVPSEEAINLLRILNQVPDTPPISSQRNY